MKKLIVILTFFAFSFTQDPVTRTQTFELKSIEIIGDSIRVHYEVKTFLNGELFLIDPNEDCIIEKDFTKVQENFNLFISKKYE